MKKIVSIFLLTFFMLSGVNIIYADIVNNIKNVENTPYELIKNSTAKIVVVINHNNDNALDVDIKAIKIKTMLEEILNPVVDFKSIAKAVMGKHYRTATKIQQQQFAGILQETMLALYTKVLVNFDIKNVLVEQPTEEKPFKGRISMQVMAEDGGVYNISYTMRKNKQQEWKIRNVVLDGINLGLTYRNQFYSSVDRYNGDLSKVINGWEDGNS